MSAGWPANVACDPPGLVYANGTTAVGNSRYLHRTKWSNGLEVYNRYGYFETAGVPTGSVRQANGLHSLWGG